MGNERIEDFFKHELLPVSRKVKEIRKAYFANDFDETAPSYFVNRMKISMNKDDFENGAVSGPNNFEKQLESLWMSQSQYELITLKASLADLAKSLIVTEELDEDVSPFIYVMF